jgi:hypothetical protein
MALPQLTIVIPTRNRARLALTAVASVLVSCLAAYGS